MIGWIAAATVLACFAAFVYWIGTKRAIPTASAKQASATSPTPKKNRWGWLPSAWKSLTLAALLATVAALVWAIYTFGGQYVEKAAVISPYVPILLLFVAGTTLIFKKKKVGGVLITLAIIVSIVGYTNIMTIGDNIGKMVVSMTDPNAAMPSSTETTTTGPIVFGPDETRITRLFNTETRRVFIPTGGKCFVTNPGLEVLEIIATTNTYMDLKPKRPVAVTFIVHDGKSNECRGGNR